MYMYFIIFIIIFFLSLMILLLGNFFSKKIFFELEKMSPFECGFNPKFNARLPFSLRFFLISIIFLVFDVELVLMFPFLINISYLNIYYFLLMIMFFIFILLLGLIHEWNQGSLDWSI